MPEGRPLAAGGRLGEWIGGAFAAVTAAAYARRARTTGNGEFIDLSLFDVGLMALVDAGQDFLQNGRVHHRVGSITRNLSPAQPFRFSGSPLKSGPKVSSLGEHTKAVLAEAGLGAEEIKALTK